MTLQRMVNDSVHWYMHELTSRVVAQSGIPTDRHHLGKIILQSLKDAPDFVLQALTPNTEVLNIYGSTELAGLAFYGDNPAPGSSGKPMGFFQYRIIDYETGQDIYEPNVSGELWIKGPSPFKGYYNDVVATKDYFTNDGWLQTGDIFYRDENWNFFFVDRIRLLFKCMYMKISPVEIEGVIRKHPGVLDVAVLSISHSEWCDLPVACVVPRPGAQPTADEIKN